jgi:hypothetical protein
VIPLAHVGGVPIEEFLVPTVTGGVAAGAAIMRNWMSVWLRRRRGGR